MSEKKLVKGTIVLASHNAGKLKELVALLGPHGFVIKTASDLDLAEPEETGLTFEDNALLKARAATEATGLPSIADDSGIAVTALDGDPGIYSARWAGPSKDFDMAMRTVEEKLQGLGTSVSREAKFISVIAVAWPTGHTRLFRGEVTGELVWPPRGTGGFGYDSMFRPEDKALTFGEMTPAQKKQLSHRARAFARLVADGLQLDE